MKRDDETPNDLQNAWRDDPLDDLFDAKLRAALLEAPASRQPEAAPIRRLRRAAARQAATPVSLAAPTR